MKTGHAPSWPDAVNSPLKTICWIVRVSVLHIIATSAAVKRSGSAMTGCSMISTVLAPAGFGPSPLFMASIAALRKRTAFGDGLKNLIVRVAHHSVERRKRYAQHGGDHVLGHGGAVG